MPRIQDGPVGKAQSERLHRSHPTRRRVAPRAESLRKQTSVWSASGFDSRHWPMNIPITLHAAEKLDPSDSKVPDTNGWKV